MAPFGEVLCGGSDLIDTGLDFKNGNPNAWSNTALRLGTTIGGGDKLGAGKYIDKLPVQEFQKQVMKGAVNQGGEVIEDGKTN
ncbi:MAG: hypothetical protein KJ941_08435 [Bacteroidetes bacterium]|nr:hypothetical protein [Bacteroidota bacterium]